MPNPVRLIIARDLISASEVLAIDLDTQRQCGIDTADAYHFFPDCIGLDPELAQRYSQGIPIATGMSAEHWAAWLEGCEFVEAPNVVWLTVSSDDNAVDALCFTNRREIVVPPDEVANFCADCQGWNDAMFDSGRSIVVLVSADNWESWLAAHEVIELSDETAALLSA